MCSEMNESQKLTLSSDAISSQQLVIRDNGKSLMELETATV